ncbi:ImmA/IrrE family metallo-endopeptidase, partial [Peribacillus frigoritolerans]|uniref:ImmA/IrrE family metallo-endopeptidase n=1 Tax=Peribacillus frigoritolerans TaxID=450367 RepID=UPI0024178A07
CNCSNYEYIQEFLCDLFELTSVQNFLKIRWNISLTERIFKNFSKNKNLLTDSIKKNALMSLNRLKGRQKSNFAIAARHEISRLSDNDKSFILKTVEIQSAKEINEFIEEVTIPDNENWGWKDYAHFIVRFYKNKQPEREKIDFVKLGKDLGIEIYVRDFETENFDACLARDITLKSPVIFVNSYKKSKGRINFSIAHELGHAIIPKHSQSNFFCFIEDVTESNRFIMDKQLEYEANSFASYLLLPDKEFKLEISNLDFTMRNVNLLSKKYDTSLVLVAKKWVEQSNLDIAMTFSTNGLIDWSCTSDTFPFSWVDYIDQRSTVFAAIDSFERKIKRKKVYSSKWFNKEYPRYILQEESVKIFDKKVLTLLQIIEDV